MMSISIRGEHNVVIYNGVNLQHIGDFLYADGVKWAYIGSSNRVDCELIIIYCKYLQSSE